MFPQRRPPALLFLFLLLAFIQPATGWSIICSDSHRVVALAQKVPLRSQAIRGGEILYDSNTIQVGVVLGLLLKNQSYFESQFDQLRTKLPSDVTLESLPKDLSSLNLTPNERSLLGLYRQLTRPLPTWFTESVGQAEARRSGMKYTGTFLQTQRGLAENLNREYALGSDGYLILKTPGGILHRAFIEYFRTGEASYPVVKSQATPEEYRRTLEILEGSHVGGFGEKGKADREIIADLFWAEKTGHENIGFATLDVGVGRGLLRLHGQSQSQADALIKALKNPSTRPGVLAPQIELHQTVNENGTFNVVRIDNIPLKLSENPRHIKLYLGYWLPKQH